MSDSAVFLDRDKTIIEDPGFIDKPELVRLKADAAVAIRRFRDMGFKVVVATNQSGIARGLLSEEQLGAVHERLCELLRSEGADLDAIYHCPYLDGADAVVERYRKDSELRKPNPGLLLKAAREMDLDLSRSWMIGDRASDIEAGQRAGCRTIRIALGAPQHNCIADPSFWAGSLMEAASIVEENTSKSAESPREGHARYEPGGVELLAEIRDLLDRQRRAETQEDFSVLRLFGTLAQMLAVVAAVWGVFGMFDRATIASAVARFGLAIFLQLVALTVFVVDRRR